MVVVLCGYLLPVTVSAFLYFIFITSALCIVLLLWFPGFSFVTRSLVFLFSFCSMSAPCLIASSHVCLFLPLSPLVIVTCVSLSSLIVSLALRVCMYSALPPPSPASLLSFCLSCCLMLLHMPEYFSLFFFSFFWGGVTFSVKIKGLCLLLCNDVNIHATKQ